MPLLTCYTEDDTRVSLDLMATHLGAWMPHPSDPMLEWAVSRTRKGVTIVWVCEVDGAVAYGLAEATATRPAVIYRASRSDLRDVWYSRPPPHRRKGDALSDDHPLSTHIMEKRRV